MRTMILGLFLASLGYCLYLAAEFNAQRISGLEFWKRVGIAYLIVAACIATMAVVEHFGGFAVWTRRRQRGFDVITKEGLK